MDAVGVVDAQRPWLCGSLCVTAHLLTETSCHTLRPPRRAACVLHIANIRVSSHSFEQAFDSNGYYRGYIPASLGATVVHVIFIQGWNKVYRSVATKLTDRENHRTEEVCTQIRRPCFGGPVLLLPYVHIRPDECFCGADLGSTRKTREAFLVVCCCREEDEERTRR